jgi:hypothetical protein
MSAALAEAAPLNAICTRCRGPYAAQRGQPIPPAHVCSRCQAVEDLLRVCGEVNVHVDRALKSNSLGDRTYARSVLVRMNAAVEHARRFLR